MDQEITRPLYESRNREANLERYGDNHNCICCGKPMARGSHKWVHMNTDWMAVNPELVTEENCEEMTGAGSQGCFPIGNDCARKMGSFAFSEGRMP